MAKKIIILERIGEPSDYNFNVLFWLDIPIERQSFFVNSKAVSIYKEATAEEIQAIKDGKIKEMSFICNYPAGTSLSDIKTNLITKYTAEQNNLNNTNPFIRYGTYWDGSSWTSGGVI